MVINWMEVWESHPDLFVTQNWIECPEEKRKAWRLPAHFSYFMGGDTALRVGIIATDSIHREEDFLLGGMLCGNRLSNGAKTLIYFVAPDFSPAFLYSLSRIGGNISVKAVYWREKLNPSLYMIPESNISDTSPYYSLGERKPDWNNWGKGLNPVARNQLDAVKVFFQDLRQKDIRIEFKPKQISILWGNIEIAEVRRKGKKFELKTKTKWEKNSEISLQWQKSGWVDSSQRLNEDFCKAIIAILNHLETRKSKGNIRTRDLLSYWLRAEEDIVKQNWGDVWEWKWQPRERGENWVSELGQWYYFKDSERINVVCPMIERPLAEASKSIILSSLLVKSTFIRGVNDGKEKLGWDGKIHWLILPGMEDELKRWHSWLKLPEKFPIWVLPENWESNGLRHLSNLSIPSNSFIDNWLD